MVNHQKLTEPNQQHSTASAKKKPIKSNVYTWEAKPNKWDTVRNKSQNPGFAAKNSRQNNTPTLDLCVEAKGILSDLFRQYPPREDEAVEQSIYKDVYKSFRRKDDFFCRPKMDRWQIANKMKALARKVEKDAKLEKIYEMKHKLPIASFRNYIISTIAKHQVVLISGEPGCGKTTQVPQLLLDYMWAKGESCKIVCTQPRRISATSVAERVAEERGESIGETVGYKIRLESCGGRQSSIVFCTNGLMLRVLVSGGVHGSQSTRNDISELTHIIVDEIHERDQNSDFIIAILRDVLPMYPHLRLVMMSATLDAVRFSEYFGGCPIIRIPGFTYPVKSFYLDDVVPLLKSVNTKKANLEADYRAILDEAIEMACSNDDFDPLLDLIYTDGSPQVINYQHSSTGVTTLMLLAGKGRVSDVCTLLALGADCHLQACNGSTAFNLATRENQPEIADIIKKHIENTTDSSKEENLLNEYMSNIKPAFIDVNLIEKLLQKICLESSDGAILVFLPGWDDINKTRDRLLANPYFQNSSKFMILPLHSMVPPDEQKMVFKRPPFGCRKIVLSTNISETSVTIDDVVFVIDSGRMKEKSYDPCDNVSTLQTCWISQASAKQREGRAGRCRPGVCYHLYSKMKAASLQPFQVPEIRRMPIDELCLQAKILDPNCKIEEFLKKTLDPPVTEAIKNAITVLQDIGALSPDEQLTELGSKLGSLSVHPFISRMLFFAIMLNCLDPALTLASVSGEKNPFNLPMCPAERKKADAAKVELASLYGGSSDQLATIAAFDCWNIAKEKGLGTRFCSEYFVSPKSMRKLAQTRKHLLDELIRGRFITGSDVSSYSMNGRDVGIVRAIVGSGLYPMVGKLRKSGNSRHFFVDTMSWNQVKLHPQSVICRSSVKPNCDQHPLVVFDKVIRGDGGLLIRDCTAISPLPLLLFAKEIVVGPANGSGFNGDNDVEVEKLDEVEGRIMSCPDSFVTVVVDGWLLYRSTALEIAQIYCLRERLSSAILSKVGNPNRVLPPELGASIYAIACLFSFDGMSGISSFIEVPSDIFPSSFLTSLIEPMPTRDELSNEYGKLLVLQEIKDRCAEIEAMMKEAKDRPTEVVGQPMVVEQPMSVGPVVAEGAVGPPVTSSNVSSSVTQESDGQPLAPVESKASLKRKRQAQKRRESLLIKASLGDVCLPVTSSNVSSSMVQEHSEPPLTSVEPQSSNRCESGPTQACSVLSEGAVCPPVTSLNLSSSMTEPGKPTLTPVESKSSRRKCRRKANLMSDSQAVKESPIVPEQTVGPPLTSSNVSSSKEESPIVAEQAVGPVVAEGVVGTPVTSPNVSSGMTQEHGKSPLAPVESKASRKRKRKAEKRRESQAIQASLMVSEGDVGPPVTSSNVISSMTQEPSEPLLTLVEPQSSRRSESQPIRASSVVSEGAVGPPVTSSNGGSSMTEPGKTTLTPVESKSSRKKRKRKANLTSESHPVKESPIVTERAVGPVVAEGAVGPPVTSNVGPSMGPEPYTQPIQESLMVAEPGGESQPIHASSVVPEGDVGPPLTSSNMSSSMTQEPDKQPLTPVESKSARRKRRRKANLMSESQPIEKSPIVTERAVGPPLTSSNVSPSMAQEPSNQPIHEIPIVAERIVGPSLTSSTVQTLTPVESKSARRKCRRKANLMSESQPIEKSPLVTDQSVGPPVTSSNVSPSLAQEPGKQAIQESPIVAERDIGPPLTSSNVSPSMAQEPGRQPIHESPIVAERDVGPPLTSSTVQPLTPVESKSARRKRRRKANLMCESQPIEKSPPVTDQAVGSPLTSSNVSPGMTQEPGKQPIHESPIVAERAMGPPLTTSNVGPSMAQEPGKQPIQESPIVAERDVGPPRTSTVQPLTPVESKSARRKRRRKANLMIESQPVEKSPIVTDQAVGPPLTSSNVSPGMTQEPGKQPIQESLILAKRDVGPPLTSSTVQPLTPVESKSARRNRRRKANLMSESQTVEKSPIVADQAVGPPLTSLNVSPSMAQESGKQPIQESLIVAEWTVSPPLTSTVQPLTPVESKSARRKCRRKANLMSESQPVEKSPIVTDQAVGPPLTSLNVSPSMAQDPGKQPIQESLIVAERAVGPPLTSSTVQSLTPVESKSARQRHNRKVKLMSESQTIQASPVVEVEVGSMAVGPLVPLSQAS